MNWEDVMMAMPKSHVRIDDDVDRIVDALVADPTRAEDLKSVLRSKLVAPDAVRVALPFRAVSVASEEAEDMWDNVPV
jgi:hypothetical protein